MLQDRNMLSKSQIITVVCVQCGITTRAIHFYATYAWSILSESAESIKLLDTVDWGDFGHWGE